mmetsp:Transcript_116926/g.376134  ORF Transcript_116926/g.376134 Transcript_116926/m.376134 type:complete len:1290 (+) Transcript_116926:36-3905(+)
MTVNVNPSEEANKDAAASATVAVAEKKQNVSIFYLYRWADPVDKLLMAIGIIFAGGQGCVMPLFAVVFGDSMTASVGNGAGATYVETMRPVLVSMGLLSIGIFCAGTIWQTCFNLSAERQGARIRAEYFEKVITRDIGWFDKNDASALPTRMASEVQTIQDAIGAKTGQVFVSGTQFVVGLIVGFVQGWELSLVICGMIPVMGLSGVYFGKQLSVLQSQKQEWFGKAGAVAEEIFIAIRVVASFGGERRAVERFEALLRPARRGGIIAGCHIGLSFGLVMSCFAWGYALAFWYGAHHMIASNRINGATGQPFQGSEVIMVFFAVIIGVMSLNDLAPPMLALTQAKSCAADMKRVIEGDSQIEDSRKSDLPMPAQVSALNVIEFKDVRFSYPSRPDNKILQGLSLTIHKGQKVALVGESGSGKSTVIQLLERFYDPMSGVVTVNGVDLKMLPLGAWRRFVGYVGQEPVLFATTIFENIKGGNPNITKQQAEEAVKQAHAWEFIDALPKKLDTYVGIGGGQLSGGQKQRVAIARALAKKPQLLLLDEATSALDNESEKSVQAALDALQSSTLDGLTTITIAHRLSTIRNSNQIFVIKAGQRVEQGTHAELMAAKGEYSNLVQSQGGGETEAAGGAHDRANTTNVQTSGEAGVNGTATEVAKGFERQVSGNSASKPKAPLNDHEEEKRRIKELADMKYKPPFLRMYKMCKGDWWVLPLAILGSLLAGTSFPIQGYLLSDASGGFYETCDGKPYFETSTPISVCPDAMLDRLNGLCLYFVAAGFGGLVGEFLKYVFFTVLQEGLILKLRSAAFAALVRQDVGFFDDPKNGPGGLTTTLARQTFQVAQMTGLSAGNAAGAAFAMILGLTLGFIGSWKLALAILAMVPFLMVAMAVVFKAVMGGGDADAAAKYSVSGEIASEAILNIRTVRALMAEGQVTKGFNAVVNELAAKEGRGAPRKGFAFGFGNAIMFMVYLLGFGYGAVLADEGLAPNKMYQALMCIMMGAMGASFAVAFSGDTSKAKLAAFDVFAIIDRASKIDAVVPTGDHKSLGDGSIQFADVRFNFPHRPDTVVLKGLSFKVSTGQSVALVGPSGSGKSTVIQLLQRFYDPSSGSILVGGVELTKFDVSWWRQQIGFVGQEPILFDMSIEDNVKYGSPNATHDDVVAVARKANMDYVLEGRVKWTDVVGTKGGKLSGGQKQRCAIARALIRDPKVLLLDEATSALDSASERVVQDALDAAKKGRTTFTIAHRLSTIRDSDQILVVGAGVVVESGTHEELLALGGLYNNLESIGKQ